MLEDAILAAKAGDMGLEREAGPSPQITVDAPIMIPEEYVPDLAVRMGLYRRLNDARDQGEIESLAAEMIDRFGPLPAPTKGRLSRRVKSFPITPRVDLRPDEKAQRWLLSVSASDRAGLLYGITRVLARYDINVQLAKVTTLGERVEDTFLISGAQLQMNKRQIEIETELLETLEG